MVTYTSDRLQCTRHLGTIFASAELGIEGLLQHPIQSPVLVGIQQRGFRFGEQLKTLEAQRPKERRRGYASDQVSPYDVRQRQHRQR